MVDELGDKQFDDEYTRYNNTGSTINEGEWVVPTGDDNVALADANGAGGYLWGVAKESIENGEWGAVAVGNVRPVRVESGVVAGDELGAPDSSTSGTPGVAVAGGSSGKHAHEDAYDDGGGLYRALVKVDA